MSYLELRVGDIAVLGAGESMDDGDDELESAIQIGDSKRLKKKKTISEENAHKIQLKLQAALYGSTAAKFFAKYGHVCIVCIDMHAWLDSGKVVSEVWTCAMSWRMSLDSSQRERFNVYTHVSTHMSTGMSTHACLPHVHTQV